MTTEQFLAGHDLLAWRHRQLRRGGRSVDLDWLLDLGGGVSWSDLQRLLIDSQGRIAIDQSLEELEKLWLLHLEQSTPLQHLVGVCPWRDLLIAVSSAALIPRQETELLVDLALAFAGGRPPRSWADLGTGCGAIAVSLCRAWPDAEGHAVDLSVDALALAETNLKTLAPQQSCRLHHGSWWAPLRAFWGQLEIVDGLEAICAMLVDAPRALAPGGVLFLEHHHDQSERVQDLMRRAGLVNVSSANDLEGIARFAQGQRALSSAL